MNMPQKNSDKVAKYFNHPSIKNILHKNKISINSRLIMINALYRTGVSKIKIGHFKSKVINTIVDTVIGIVL